MPPKAHSNGSERDAPKKAFFDPKNPVGQKRHLDVAGKNCRKTIFVSQLSRNYPHRGGNFERKQSAL